MGNTNTKITTGGTLIGAYAPPLKGATVPPPPVKSYRITVPRDVQKGTKAIIVTLGSERVHVPIPAGIKAGDQFTYNHGLPSSVDVKKVIASTLPQIPGMEIVQSRPIIWGSVSHAFHGNSANRGDGMGHIVGKLLQDAQKEILGQVARLGCNAVLGMTFNVTNDSSGEHGHYKNVIVTLAEHPASLLHNR